MQVLELPKQYAVLDRDSAGKLQTVCAWLVDCPYVSGVTLVDCTGCPADGRREAVSYVAALAFWKSNEVEEVS